mgnify:CR=1 FL=1
MSMSARPVDVVVVEGDRWIAWPMYWGPIWVGALAALAAAVIFGLVGLAIGAHQVGTAGQITKWSDVSRASVVFTVFAAFLAFVVGGWVTGKTAGIGRSEPAMLHGAITWLVALPLLIVLMALGGGGALGGWYGGLVGTPAWVVVTTPPDPNAAILARNAALAAITAGLLGLIGSVIGGWMASGEPMSVTHYRQRAVGVRH